MYHAARPERRRAVGGLLASIALTSILTGVTEPIEFTFMFLAPALYAVHALLTGIAFVIMNALHVRLGFGFSAGLFDYVLNFNKATRPLLLLPVGLAYFALYYGLFRFVISWLNLKTPGREEEAPAADTAGESEVPADRALAYIKALGGASNIVALDACTTRLRLVVNDQSVVDAEALKRLGVRGMVKPSANALQVVVGTNADQVAGEMKTALRAAGGTAASVGGAPGIGSPAASRSAHALAATPVLTGTPDLTGAAATAPTAAAVPAATSGAATTSVAITTTIPTQTLTSLLAALGGRSNVRAVEAASSRLRINIADASIVDQPAIASLGMRGIALAAPNWVHIIIGPEAAAAGISLRQLPA
jgi:PTS system N-acetylglucosamine-specific IIC component